MGDYSETFFLIISILNINDIISQETNVSRNADSFTPKSEKVQVGQHDLSSVYFINTSYLSHIKLRCDYVIRSNIVFTLEV